MFKVLIPAVAALGLVALAAQQSQGETAVSNPFMDTPVMAWSVHHEGTLAKLAYGVANSDQLALMVSCTPGDRTAVVYGDVHLEGTRLMQARLESDPLSAGDARATRVAVDDPALTALAQRGRMTVIGEAGRFQLAASGEERRLVRNFLAYCSPGRA